MWQYRARVPPQHFIGSRTSEEFELGPNLGWDFWVDLDNDLPVKDFVGYTLVGFGDDGPFEYQARLSSKFLFALSSGLK